MEKFELKLDYDYFKKGDILEAVGTKLKVVSTPNFMNYKWWHRLLNIITLGFFWNKRWTYKVRIV